MVYVVFLLPYIIVMSTLLLSVCTCIIVSVTMHMYYCARVRYYAHVLLCPLLSTCIMMTITMHMHHYVRYYAHIFYEDYYAHVPLLGTCIL